MAWAMPLVAGKTWIFDGVGPCAPPVYQMVFPKLGGLKEGGRRRSYRPRICTSIGPSVTLMTLSGPWPVEPSTSLTVPLDVTRFTGPGGVGAGLLLYRTMYAAPSAFNAPSTIKSTSCPCA